MRSPLTIAASQPRCTPNDVRANALEHAQAIREAQARIVVFPELSLTGYELDAEAVSPDDEALMPIIAACTETDAVALVGAPVAGTGRHVHIGMVRVSSAGAAVASHKSFLYGDELARFSPGGGPAVLELDGWRIGLGICKDTGVERHVADVAALNVDVYAAGVVHRREALDEQESRAVRIARACNAYVAFASFAGAAGGGFDRTAGVSSIWAADGTPISRAGVEPGDLARASLTPPDSG
jgi:predicted amidohydrolase